MIENLDAGEIDAFLRRQFVGRVGCHTNGATYVVPVIYAWSGDAVYVYSVSGRKIEMMRANPQVCFEVDEYLQGGSWSSVIVDGVYEELEGTAADKALALLLARFSGARRQAARSTREPVAFRIRPTALSGRRVTRHTRALRLSARVLALRRRLT